MRRRIFPSLTNAQETEFDIPAGGFQSVVATGFSSLSVLNLPSGATFNAPPLTIIFDSNIILAGGASFCTRSLSQIDSTQLAVTGGAQINNIIATSYNINRVGTYTPLSVDGVRFEDRPATRCRR